MRQISIDGQQELEVNERTFTVYYHAAASMAYWPAQTSGPVEHCYPDESECDIDPIRIYQIASVGEPSADYIFQNDKELMQFLHDAIDLDIVEEQLWEAFHQGD